MSAGKTRVEFTPKPRVLTTRQARYEFTLEPKQEQSVFVTVSCERNLIPVPTNSYQTAFKHSAQRSTNERLHNCQITTSNKRVNSWLKRSEADLRMLTDAIPKASIPTPASPGSQPFLAATGSSTRLKLCGSHRTSPKSVLQYLADEQATEEIPEQDAEPGKILHEMRRGEMAALKEVPFGRYYGSVDSHAVIHRSGRRIFLRTRDTDFILHLVQHSGCTALDRYVR